MKVFLPLSLLLMGAAPIEPSTTYLLSIGHIPITDTESIEAFSLKTWGVEFKSVCQIPSGWRIKVGNGATPDGTIEGEGSQGATWFNRGSPEHLRAFLLVQLHGPVQQANIGSPDNGVPATFQGYATVNTDDGDVQRPLTYRNITLTPARHCPTKP